MSVLPSDAFACRVVLLFPGQGSQFSGMGRDLCAALSSIRERVDQASDVIGEDLAAIMFGNESHRLTSTEMAQTSVFVLSTALAEHLATHGIGPAAVAGHSLGEYSALVTAGCISWEEGVRLVWQRGCAMAQATAERAGAMASIAGLPTETVRALCAEAGEVVVANYNSPSQTVISGEAAAVATVTEKARQAGLVKIDWLRVAGAFHSPLMEPAGHLLTPVLQGVNLREPQVPFVSSITGRLVTDLATYREDMQRQITLPVRWQETVATLQSLGAQEFAEVGPGRVLTGLTRQCDRSLTVHTVGDLATCESIVTRRGRAAQ